MLYVVRPVTSGHDPVIVTHIMLQLLSKMSFYMTLGMFLVFQTAGQPTTCCQTPSLLIPALLLVLAAALLLLLLKIYECFKTF